MPITALPPAPSRADPPATFVAKADAFVAALQQLVTEMNAVVGVANITKWVSGTTYAIGDVTWSPLDFQAYRRKTAGAGTTDPSLDTTNWQRTEVSGTSLQGQDFTAFTSAGAAPAFTATPSPAFTAYAAGQRLRVKFHAAGTTGSNTLNVSGKGAKSIKQYDATGTKVAGVVASGQLADVEYDGADWVILDPLPVNRQIQPINASLAANALTLTLNPTTLDFRSSTLASGTVNTRTVSSAISLTISSGSTLGTVNAQAARLVVLAIDNAGTVELAAVNIAGGNNLDETTLISTTAEGGAGTADSANVIYSTTARTNVPFRVVGFIDITQATAGTWVTAPSTIQGAGGQALTGLIAGTVTDVTASRANSTTYYNTSGRYKTVYGHGTVNGSTTSNAFVNGTQVWAHTGTATGSGNSGAALRVPPGGSYMFSFAGSLTKVIEVQE